MKALSKFGEYERWLRSEVMQVMAMHDSDASIAEDASKHLVELFRILGVYLGIANRVKL